MSVIKLPLLYVGSKGEKTLHTLFDSGTNLSCINPNSVEQLELPVSLGRIRRIGTTSEGHYIEVKEVVRLDFYLNNVLLSDEFLLVPGLSEEVVLGAATMQKCVSNWILNMIPFGLTQRWRNFSCCSRLYERRHRYQPDHSFS